MNKIKNYGNFISSSSCKKNTVASFLSEYSDNSIYPLRQYSNDELIINTKLNKLPKHQLNEIYTNINNDISAYNKQYKEEYQNLEHNLKDMISNFLSSKCEGISDGMKKRIKKYVYLKINPLYGDNDSPKKEFVKKKLVGFKMRNVILDENQSPKKELVKKKILIGTIRGNLNKAESECRSENDIGETIICDNNLAKNIFCQYLIIKEKNNESKKKSEKIIIKSKLNLNKNYRDPKINIFMKDYGMINFESPRVKSDSPNSKMTPENKLSKQSSQMFNLRTPSFESTYRNVKNQNYIQEYDYLKLEDITVENYFDNHYDFKDKYQYSNENIHNYEISRQQNQPQLHSTPVTASIAHSHQFNNYQMNGLTFNNLPAMHYYYPHSHPLERRSADSSHSKCSLGNLAERDSVISDASNDRRSRSNCSKGERKFEETWGKIKLNTNTIFDSLIDECIEEEQVTQLIFEYDQYISELKERSKK